MTAALDLWVFPLDPREPLAGLEAMLAPDERIRAGRFVHATDRERFITGRGLLRVILASYLEAAPASLVIAAGPNGKPQLDEQRAPLHFNLSHSGAIAALAVTPACEVGIDIEQVRPIETGFAERFYSKAENAELATLPQAEHLVGLFRCWSRKEAILKAQGVGLLGDFKSFDVEIGDVARPHVAGLNGPWSLVAFTPAPGYVGALAARTAEISIEHRLLSEIWPSQPRS